MLRAKPASATTLAIALALFAPVAPVSADTVEASRARIVPANLALPETDARQCWARYTINGGKARNGALEEVAFRVPCPEHVTDRFISTLQRALAARGYYDGAATGRADNATRAAVQAFQRDNGFNSPILTLESAQRLGLVPIEITRN